MKNKIKKAPILSSFYWEASTVIVLNKLLTNASMEQIDVDMILRDATIDGLFIGDSHLVNNETSSYVKSNHFELKRMKVEYSDLVMYLVANYFDQLTSEYFNDVAECPKLIMVDTCDIEVLVDWESPFEGSLDDFGGNHEEKKLNEELNEINCKGRVLEYRRARACYRISAICAESIINNRSIRLGIFNVHNILQTKESQSDKLSKMKMVIDALDISPILDLFNKNHFYES